MMKKLVALLMALALLCTSIGAFATEEETVQEPAPAETVEESVEESEVPLEAEEDDFDKAVVDIDRDDYNGTKVGIAADILTRTGVKVDVGQHTEGYLKTNSVKAPSCKEAGSITYYCAGCFKPIVFDLGYAEHTKPADAKIVDSGDPGCITDGYIKYEGICTVCLTKQTWTETIKARGYHVADGKEPEVIDPTCTEDGKIIYTCKDCGLTFEEKGKDALKHSWEVDPDQAGQAYVVKATCAEDGKYSFAVVCKNCGEVKPGSEDEGAVSKVDKLNHQAKLDELVKENENDVYIVDEKTGVVTINPNFAANYETGDKITGEKVLLNPEAEESITNPVIAVYGDCVVTYTPATCTEKGYVSIACKTCEAKIEKELDALGHDMDDEEEAGNPRWEDCTKPNSYLSKCQRPGCDYYENVDIPARAEHKFEWVIGYSQVRPGGNTVVYYAEDYWTDGTSWEEALDAAKDNIGTCYDYKEIVECVWCMKTTTRDKAGDGKHDVDPDVPSIDIAETCTTEGKSSYRCAKCGYYQTEITPATGHKMVEGQTLTAATCTTEGLVETYCVYCCEYQMKDGQPVLGEDGKKIVVAKKDGGEVIKGTKVLPTIDHDWRTYSSEPNCLEDKLGYSYEQCTMCKEKRNEKVLTGHQPISEDAVYVVTEPTCTTDGMRKYECKICHEWVPDETIPALGHSYQRTDTGILTDKEVKDNHISCDVEDAACIPHTCMVNTKHVLECADCDAVLTWDDNDAPMKHNMVKEGALNKFQILVVPNCERTGTAQYVCADCGEIVTYTLAKLPHNLQAKWDKDANVYYFTCEPIYNSLEPEDGKCGLSCLNTLIQKTYSESELVGAAVYNALILMTPNGQKIGTFGTCEYTEEIPVLRTEYAISTENGKGKIELKDENMSEPFWPYVRITWGYTLANGDTVAFTACRDTDWVEDGDYYTFKLTGLRVPSDAKLDYIYVEVVADADADEKFVGQYETYGEGSI